MKFSPLSWKEETGHAEVEVGKGRVQLRIAREVPVYVICEGVEALVGVGSSFDFDLAAAAVLKVGADKTVRWFRAVPEVSAVSGEEGPVFSNVDRMPVMGGQIAEVTAALRAFKLEQAETLRTLRAERAKLRAAQRAAAPAAPPAAAPVEQVVE